MSEGHQKTREFLASLPASDVPALLHLLACDDCALDALGSLTLEEEKAPRPPEPELDYEEVFQRLESRWPGLVRALEERRAQAESLFAALLDLPPGERLQAVQGQERFHESPLAELLLERSRANQPEPHRSEELARLAYAVARQSASKTKAETTASLKVRACCLLGNALRLRGDLRDADAAFLQAAHHLAGSLDLPERAMFSEMLAYLRLAQGRIDESLALLWRAGYLAGLEGDFHQQGICLAWAGLVYLDHDGLEKALEILTQARILLEQDEEPALACRVRLGLALCHAAIGRRGTAARHVEEARSLYPRIQDPETRVRLHWAEGRVAARAGKVQEGLELLLSARQRWIQLGNLQDAALATLDAALVMAECGQTGDIHPLIHELMDRFSNHPAVNGVLVALWAFEVLTRQEGEDLKEARSLAAAYLRRMGRNTEP